MTVNKKDPVLEQNRMVAVVGVVVGVVLMAGLLCDGRWRSKDEAAGYALV